MSGRRVMAGGAGCGETGIFAGGMTTIAGQARMCIGQGKTAMIEIGRLPGAGGVALCAIGAVLAVVMILMACAAIGRSALVDIVGMAIGTGNIDMGPG